MTLDLVIAVGIAVAFLQFVVVVQILLARLANRARVRKQERVERLWLPILTAGADDAPEALPPLPTRDVVPFLTLWNQLHASFVGDITLHMKDVARRIGVDRTARQMLTARSLTHRLLAVSTLGHLGDRDAWEGLVRMTGHKDGLLSLAAAHALTRIDAAAALPVLLPRIAERDDWSRNHVLAMLEALGADIVSKPLTEAALRVPPDRAQRLVQYLSVAHQADAVPVVRSIIASTRNADCIAACLRVFADVDHLDAVRDYLRHESWQVRVQAVNVLARLGSAADFTTLVPLLADPEWWVRYRAAEAICSLPGVDKLKIKRLSREHHDPFARDMLVHVLAEARA
jgi:hypothetical protein